MGSDTEHATLLVTDDAGRQLGYINGNLVNQIPGAHVDRVISAGDWTDNIAPNFYVPADVKYTVSLDGASLQHPRLRDPGHHRPQLRRCRPIGSPSGLETRTAW